MNIPLNIDLQQIFLHLFNFSILTLGLYLLLYNPVKKFMGERVEYYSVLDKEAIEKLEQAKNLGVSYQERLEHVETAIEERKAIAAQEIKQEAEELLQNAEKEAAKILSDVHDAAQEERTKILEETQEEIANIAISATEKLLAQSASGALDQFLDAVKKE